MSFIEFQKVSLTFQTKTQRIPIFEELDLEIGKGELVTIYGPSGKGKSTLLNLVSGFLRPTAGKIFVDAADLCTMPETAVCKYRNQRIGYLFQTFNLIQQFNVWDNVSVPLLLSGMQKTEIKKRVEALLETVGLSERKLEYPRTLSGGEQQRAAFARAIANDPDILLADEPTGNLDAANGEKLIEMLRTLNRSRNITVLCVTHDPRFIETEQKNGGRMIDIETITKQM
ncbi:MAG: ABC transporter ATP-binding protein [Clostridia bacterium]